MSERSVKLSNGYELLWNDEERILFVRYGENGIPILTSSETEIDIVLDTLQKAQSEVESLTAEVKKQTELKHEIYRANEVWQEQYEKGQTEVVRLQKALDLAHSHLTYGGVSEALECMSKALGEEVES